MEFEKLNILGKKRIPFLFICDYKAQNLEIIELDKLQDFDVKYNISKSLPTYSTRQNLIKFPISFKDYKKKFDSVIEKIKSGETYLLNLTQSTPIDTKLNLKDIYNISNANYKLYYKNRFVCFSPETFVKIANNKINTFPMKGTIDASITDAKKKILENKKEMAEHVMVVDLLRNDISKVSKNVKVKNFRYVSKIDAGDKKLLQVSSHICGDLQNNWNEKIGDILKLLLPAGSITGTPKKSTMKIIEDVEGYDREFYTGIFGVFDGKSLDSGVMIRFIENKNDNLVYKSGGGITLDSDPKKEYQELIDKIYI
jgi:para-aminobenzoate synthetase component 1